MVIINKNIILNEYNSNNENNSVMEVKIMKKLLYPIIMLLLLSGSNAFSQRIEIIDIETQDYPTLRAFVRVYDEADMEVRDFQNINDFDVLVNTEEREVTDVYCEDKKPRISMILDIDRTTSMSTNNLGGPTKAAAKKLVEYIVGGSDCAIMSFSTPNYVELNSDFTTDHDQLNDAIDRISFIGFTDMNSAFFGNERDIEGAIDLAARAKWYPVILLLTDGEHDFNNGPFRESEIISRCKAIGVPVYVVTLGMEVPDYLRNVAMGTGGEAYSAFKNSEIEQFVLKIFNDARKTATPDPCVVEWTAECDDSDVEIKLNRFGGINVIGTYTIPDELKPNLSADPRNVVFLNKTLGTNADTTITICAEKNFIEFDGTMISDPRFEVVDWGGKTLPFRLEEDECIDITLRFKPNAEECVQPDFSFNSTACSGLELNPEGAFLIAKDLNFGVGILNQDLEKDFDAAFCNHSCNDITIKSFQTTGGDAGFFDILTTGGVTVPAGECVKIKINFKPTDTKSYATKWVVETNDGKKFEAQLTGSGSGQAMISAINELSFGELNCDVPKQCLDIDVENPGELTLNVTSIDISGADFYLNPDPGAFSIPAGEKRTINVCFETTNPGAKNVSMIINSDASNDPAFDIDLSGIYHNYDFNTDATEINIGFVCPDELVTETITLNNIGTNDIDLTAVINGDWTLPVNSLNISNGSNVQFDISFSSSTIGTFSNTLTITNTKCNTSKTITLTGEVSVPIVDGVDQTFQSTLGSFEEQVITLTNTSSRDATFDLSTDDPQFVIIVPNPATGILLAAGDPLDVTVRYTPTSETPVNAKLIITGVECDFTGDVNLIASADLAKAQIRINNYSGFVGEVVPISIDLINKENFTPSGINNITLELSFNGELLEPVPMRGTMNGNIRTISIDMSFSANDNDYSLPLDFLVLDGNGATFTDLTFANVTPNNIALITETAGRFDLIQASADLNIGDYEAEPGQIVTIPIEISNATNIVDFHQGVKTQLRFNSTVLEPLFEADSKFLNPAGEWELSVRMPTSLFSTSTAVQEYQFRAVLGNVESTPIYVENSTADRGLINFSESQGTFSLINLCEEGNVTRLFDPSKSRNVLAVPSPNPVQGDTELEFSLRENSDISIWISDITGKRVMNIVDGNFARGPHSVVFEASKLESGYYVVVLDTGLKRLSTKIHIVK